MDTKASRALVISGFFGVGALLMAPALFHHRPDQVQVVSVADGDVQPGTQIICDGRVFAPRCVTYPPGVPVPEPSRPIPFRPLPTR